MIDLKDLRERPEAYQEACRAKRIKFSVAGFIELDTRYRELLTAVETLRAEQNQTSKEVAKLSGAEKEARLKSVGDLSARLKAESAKLKELEEEWRRQQLLVPSIPAPEVPEGRDDSENVEIRREGELPNFSFTPRDHVQLGFMHDLFDIERGVKIAGARSYFLKGDGVRLNHAILQLAMDLLHERGYTLFDPPQIVKRGAMVGTGYFPGGEEMAYHLDQRDDDQYLIGTSEVPVAAYHLDEILPVAELPKRYAGFSSCFRREAGTYGKDTAGLYRVHQFYKVEQVVVCKADVEESRRFHAEILGNAESVLKALEIPYRVVDVCSGDMGQGQVYKNDIESWMPSRQSYSETHSCSTMHEFQARRLNLKYRDEDGKNKFCHTLNNTCIATPRALIPFLEIHQQEDGSIRIPVALRKYLGGMERLVPKRVA